MNYDEFGFFNQQLAGMLREGIPLEGGIKRLCATMGDGGLKAELVKLERELSGGKPLAEAVAERNLPPLYRHMVLIGARSNNLPAMLLLLADYYHRLNQVHARLKGLMVYPTLVLAASFILSIGLSILLHSLSKSVAGELGFASMLSAQMGTGSWGLLFLPPVVIGLLLLAVVAGLSVPSWWQTLRWRLPGFREAALSQFASAMTLLLEFGGNLKEAVGLCHNLEHGSPLGRDLAVWQEKLAQGAGKAPDFAAGSRLVPPLFVWLLANAGEDLAGGFRRAASLYHERATHQVEMMLYAALPVSVLFLGGMILAQLLPVSRLALGMLNMLGAIGD